MDQLYARYNEHWSRWEDRHSLPLKNPKHVDWLIEQSIAVGKIRRAIRFAVRHPDGARAAWDRYKLGELLRELHPEIGRKHVPNNRPPVPGARADRAGCACRDLDSYCAPQEIDMRPLLARDRSR